jgi:hypothetical protein
MSWLAWNHSDFSLHGIPLEAVFGYLFSVAISVYSTGLPKYVKLVVWKIKFVSFLWAPQLSAHWNAVVPPSTFIEVQSSLAIKIRAFRRVCGSLLADHSYAPWNFNFYTARTMDPQVQIPPTRSLTTYLCFGEALRWAVFLLDETCKKWILFSNTRKGLIPCRHLVSLVLKDPPPKKKNCTSWFKMYIFDQLQRYHQLFHNESTAHACT